ncbi:hypothetical protein ED328_14615 [Muribaculaceae bacterium Isolate-001 (NCI)]|nr:hypothetical protein ED328_14615 [Muribaculaceae bacterium Isolate-001 (NCI)]
MTLSDYLNIIISLTMFALLLMIYLLPVAIVAGLLLRFIRWSLVMIIRLACRIVSLVWRMVCWLLLLCWRGLRSLWRPYRHRTAP